MLRSRALTPITSAPSATARCSSFASCASTSVSMPSSCAYEISPAARWSSTSRRITSAASAPATLSFSRSSSSVKKPLASSGADVAARAALRSSSEPPKRSSTRIEIAAAPAFANWSARRAGSAFGRRSPADGERRLISAIPPSPASASRKRPIRCPQPVARRTRAARAAPRRRPSRLSPARARGPRGDPRRGRPRRSHRRR